MKTIVGVFERQDKITRRPAKGSNRRSFKEAASRRGH